MWFCLSSGCLESSVFACIDADRAIVICQRFASSLLRSDGSGVDAAKECFLLECFSALDQKIAPSVTDITAHHAIELAFGIFGSAFGHCAIRRIIPGGAIARLNDRIRPCGT